MSIGEVRVNARRLHNKKFRTGFWQPRHPRDWHKVEKCPEEL